MIFKSKWAEFRIESFVKHLLVKLLEYRREHWTECADSLLSGPVLPLMKSSWVNLFVPGPQFPLKKKNKLMVARGERVWGTG